MHPKMTDDTANLMWPEARINGNCQVVKPEFRFHVAIAHMHMRRFAAVGGVKESAIRPPSQTVGISLPVSRLALPTAAAHSGMLSCFFIGTSTALSFSIASARAIRRLVECGMMTSSM